jgi:hypothetical protein
LRDVAAVERLGVLIFNPDQTGFLLGGHHISASLLDVLVGFTTWPVMRPWQFNAAGVMLIKTSWPATLLTVGKPAPAISAFTLATGGCDAKLC